MNFNDLSDNSMQKSSYLMIVESYR